MPASAVVTLLSKPVHEIPSGSLAELRRAAGSCRACPLWKPATQTVFGAGPEKAHIVLIGEQPGDQEDRQGLPFVGPAGRLLDQALEAARLDRAALYVTNTMKHFKFEQRGKVRLHKRANAAEQAACRMWLAGELARLQPDLIVALGAMAAQTVFGATFSVTRERGRWRRLGEAAQGMATWHPSAILRAPEENRKQQYAELVTDLRGLAARAGVR
ncbi:MAG: UdgX family uracil-DNA binding protein [Gammaproteobacteria bacterium]|nr:UdgX family uracil-DNA binding protein [Gammaproteobacteria bacterium]MBV9620751.1 UdgX family uracil-DNA binding protein [Gammaproteobacteria bacterium]